MDVQEQYILINANEEVVKMLARQVMEKSGMCGCEKCFKDVCALALNDLDCHYVTSRKGEVISHALEGATESRVTMIIAVSKAIELVKNNPRHGAERP